MKSEIENLNLLYGVSIFNIISKNQNLNTNLKKLTTISINLNNFLEILSKQTDINDFNLLSTAMIILQDEKVSKLFSKANFSEQDINKIITDNISNIDVNKLASDAYLDDNYYYIDYYEINEQRNKKIDTLSYIKDLLYDNKLVYSDLIMLLINNWTFFKKIKKMQPNDWTIYFINILNLLFFELNKIVNTDRENLYYIAMIILESPKIKYLLYPNSIYHMFDKDEASNNVKHYIYDVILTSLHNINQYYYIEYSNFYNNSRTHFYDRRSEQKLEFIDSILENLNLKQIIFLFKVSNCSNKTIPLKNDDTLKDLIAALNKNSEITIYSQKVDNNIKKLIQDSYSFICQYCKQENFNVLDCCLTTNFKERFNNNFITVSINYNNYIYKFVLSKYNNNYTWKLALQKNKTYKINVCLPDDFKHLSQMMKIDNNNYHYNMMSKELN